jgi:hypothetical protein
VAAVTAAVTARRVAAVDPMAVVADPMAAVVALTAAGEVIPAVVSIVKHHC